MSKHIQAFIREILQWPLKEEIKPWLCKTRHYLSITTLGVNFPPGAPKSNEIEMFVYKMTPNNEVMSQRLDSTHCSDHQLEQGLQLTSDISDVTALFDLFWRQISKSPEI